MDKHVSETRKPQTKRYRCITACTWKGKNYEPGDTLSVTGHTLVPEYFEPVN